MDIPHERSVQFGPFELNLTTWELRRDGQGVDLPRQPARVLALLASRPGSLVTREEIRDAVWGANGVHVDFDRSLNACLRQIRAALDDDPHAPRYVETLRGLGYRFIAEVKPATADGEGTAGATAPGAAAHEPRRRVVAVLVATGVLVVSALGALAYRTASSSAVAPNSPRDEAKALYDQGRKLWNLRTQAELARAEELFRRATEIDPQFAPAFAGLGDAHMSQGFRRERFVAAEAAARRALELDPYLIEARVTLGNALMHQFNWAGAEPILRLARSSGQRYPVAHYIAAEFLVATGRPDDAVAAAEQAVRLDPGSAIAHHALGAILYYARRYDQARAEFQHALRLDPGHFWTRRRIGFVDEEAGRVDDALAEYRRLGLAWDVTRALARSGRSAEARQRLTQELGKLTPDALEETAYNWALAYAALGDRDAALEALERAYRRGVYDLVYLKVDPKLDSLRSEPRFETLLRRIGL